MKGLFYFQILTDKINFVAKFGEGVKVRDLPGCITNYLKFYRMI
jgi:hypothetical protein